MAACHSHTIYGRAMCALGKPIDMLTQDACSFYNDHAVYESFGGVVLAKEEGARISKALGTKKALLLQNHGLLTVGKSVEEAVYWFTCLEKCCHTQLLADAAGTTKKIDDDDAYNTYKNVGQSRIGHFSAKPMFDVLHKETNGDYLQ
jgi:ribulose-5-phosphate 4-epimerase/fuculose-1-phosphate aldolase